MSMKNAIGRRGQRISDVGIVLVYEKELRGRIIKEIVKLCRRLLRAERYSDAASKSDCHMTSDEGEVTGTEQPNSRTKKARSSVVTKERLTKTYSCGNELIIRV